jgi:hypothetical protein
MAVTRMDKRKLGGHWYFPVDQYTTKSEAQARKAKLLKDGYKSVRILKQMVDRRYVRYYVYAR